MRTLFSLPTGKLFPIQEVHFEPVLKISQHDELMKAADVNFERAMVAVLDQNMDEDAYSLPFCDLLFLFYCTRISTISDDITLPWTCKRTVKRMVNGKSADVSCDTENRNTFNLSQFPLKELPKKFITLPSAKFKLKESGEEVEAFVRYPTAREEFEVLEYFYSVKHISKDDLFSKPTNVIDYRNRRFLSALAFKDARYAILQTPEEKMAFLEANDVPAEFAISLRNGLQEIEDVGYDIGQVTVVCKECGGTSKFRLPHKLDCWYDRPSSRLDFYNGSIAYVLLMSNLSIHDIYSLRMDEFKLLLRVLQDEKYLKTWYGFHGTEYK